MPRTLIARSLLALSLTATLVAPARATMPRLDGSLAPEVTAAFERGDFVVPDHNALTTSAASSLTGWLLPVVMVEFTDSTLTHSGSELQAAMFDTTGSTATGSVVDYWAWASGNRIRVRGEVVARVTLPHPEDYYANSAYGLNAISTPRNNWGLVHDAVAAADASVNWNRYDRDGDGFVDMLWIVHAGLPAEGTTSRTSLWSVTSSMSGTWSNGGAYETADPVPGVNGRKVRIDRFTILPEISIVHPGALSDIGVYCHEFGHALGLPDLYDTSALGGTANVGPGNWSLMSTGAYGGDGGSPQTPTHIGGWCSRYLGFTSAVAPTRDTVVTLTPLSDGGTIMELSFQGQYSPEHFLIEDRARVSFDRNLPSSGLLVTQVDDITISLGLAYNRVNAGLTPGLRVLECDGDFDMTRGGNHGDANDVLPGALNVTFLNESTLPPLRLFNGTGAGVSIDAVEPSGTSMRARLRVRPQGWFSTENTTDPGYHPTTGFGRGRFAASNSIGDVFETFSDERTGVSQVLLRSRAFAATRWSPTEAVSASPVGAYDPTLTVIPGKGLALAWADLREGEAQIWYRACLGGVWGTETRLSTQGGGSPAIASDRLGNVQVAWIEPSAPRAAIRLLSFPAGAPGGVPAVMTDTLCVPSAPSLATTPDGHTWVVWPDLQTGNYTIRFARWSADSGAHAPMRLLPFESRPQPSVDVATDRFGQIAIAWQLVGTGTSEIHYQLRPLNTSPMPPETVLVTSSDPLQNPTLAIDRVGGVHLAFERSTSHGQVVRYMHMRPDYGWDVSPYDLSDPAQGSAGRINVTALTPGNVDVLFGDALAGTSHQRQRRRRLDPIPVAVDEPAPVSANRPPAVSLGPNPLRAGAALVLSGTRLPSATDVGLFDTAGRRVAATRVAAGEARFTPEQTRSLSPGLYFLRVPDGATSRVVVLR